MSLSFGVIQNQQNDAQTIRQPSTALLTIDSDDRFASYTAKRASSPGSYNWSPYNFQITKGSSLMNGFITRLGVSEINFPWCVPNINPKTNTIRVGYGSAASGPFTYYTVTIPYGFYTPSAFATVFQAAVRALGGSFSTFVFTYGPLTPQFSFNSGASGVYISIAPMTYNTAAYPYNDNTRQLADILGFSATGVANTSVSGAVSYLQAIHYIDIICSQLTYNQPLKDGTSQPIGRDALCRLYIVDGEVNIATGATPVYPGNIPTTIYRDYTTPKQIQWTPNQPITSGLSFEVYDDQGDPLQQSMPAGVQPNDWNITLLVSES